MKRILGLLITLFLVSVIMACGSSSEEKSTDSADDGEEYEIDIGYVTTDNDEDPYHISASLFKEYAEEMTDGKVEVNLFPNGQLGEERELLEGMQLGTIDGGIITNAYISGFEENALIFDLPFLFDDFEQAHETADGEVGDEILAGLEEQGIIGLGWTEGGFRTMINNVRPIVNPDDAKNIKFRSLENSMYLDMFESMGANPTPMSWGEVFTAVQQGTVDGLEAPVSVLYQSRFYEVSDYLSITNHTYSPLLISLSSDVWDEFSDEIQEDLLEAASKASDEQREKSQELNEELLTKFEDEGVEVNEIDNIEDFRDKVQHIHDEFSEGIGKDIMKKLDL